jgi:hypothetical protein
MPLDVLRARASEALRLIAEARTVARASFDAAAGGDRRGRAEGGTAADRVGGLLDAAERLLPGITPFAEANDRSPRSKPPESMLRRVTMRGGPERAMDQLERAALLKSVADEAAALLGEIERGRTSAHFLAADTAITESEPNPR